MKSLAAALGSALLAGCSAIGVRAGTEQPDYTVVERLEAEVEIRRYGPRTVAEVEIPATGDRADRNAAFRILANYIFGNNRAKSKIAMTAPVETERSGEKIAMTAPVETRRQDEALRMAFFLPAKYSADTAPRPLDDRVTIRAVPGQAIAALRFSGNPAADELARRQRALLDALNGSAWRPTGRPVNYFYDPPWTPFFLRRNEVAVTVERR